MLQTDKNKAQLYIGGTRPLMHRRGIAIPVICCTCYVPVVWVRASYICSNTELNLRISSREEQITVSRVILSVFPVWMCLLACKLCIVALRGTFILYRWVFLTTRTITYRWVFWTSRTDTTSSISCVVNKTPWLLVRWQLLAVALSADSRQFSWRFLSLSLFSAWRNCLRYSILCHRVPSRHSRANLTVAQFNFIFGQVFDEAIRVLWKRHILIQNYLFSSR